MQPLPKVVPEQNAGHATAGGAQSLLVALQFLQRLEGAEVNRRPPSRHYAVLIIAAARLLLYIRTVTLLSV